MAAWIDIGSALLDAHLFNTPLSIFWQNIQQLTKPPILLASIPTQKNPNIPPVGTAETDETGFGGFVSMLLSICAKLFGASPGERGFVGLSIQLL